MEVVRGSRGQFLGAVQRPNSRPGVGYFLSDETLRQRTPIRQTFTRDKVG